ncbi:MAG: ferrous iron transport protein A [Hydrococcus sp. RM1_1_31]|nr:ferrous iron transport protein A [Hydrococcus sp. RM1_1_31]
MRDSRDGKFVSWRFAFIGGTGHTIVQKEVAIANLSEKKLANAKVGDRVWIISLSDRSNNPYLQSLGLIPGTELQVISLTPNGSVIVAYGKNRIGLGSDLANTIFVTDTPMFLEHAINPKIGMTYLHEFPVGTKGRIVGYDKVFSGYTGKLLSMGLMPGTIFTVIRHAFLNHPLQIEVGGNLFNLRKPEADALCVEEIEDES